VVSLPTPLLSQYALPLTPPPLHKPTGRAGPAPSKPTPSTALPSAPTRRAALATAAAAALLAAPRLPALAEDISSSPDGSSALYTDPLDGFSLTVPAGWAQGSGGAVGGMDPNDKRARFSNAAGLQRVIAFLPPGTPDVNLAITVRTPSADFTSLGSFGTAQQWGEGVVSSMDRSYVRRTSQTGRGLFSGGASEPYTEASLVDVAEASGGGQYVVKYKVAQEGAPTRVVVSAVALGVSPKGIRRFYTINGSCTEETAGKYGAALEAAVASFTAPGQQ
jgi:hypothetical protein